MRLLVDTHILVWLLLDDPRLSQEARRTLSSASHLYFSPASIWEAGIKFSMGKLTLPPQLICENLEPSGFQELPITAQHALMAAQLPFHHRDPFDRMLVAQALSEPMRLLTADGTLGRYSDLVIVTK